MDDLDVLETQLTNSESFTQLMLRFAFNLLMVWFMVHFLYYRKSRRRDYYFTFMLISISIFFLIFLLGNVKLKIGFALGLFAIFGIIRYRTESMPVREMTYLFVIIAMSVINALAVTIGYVELLTANLLFILCTWCCESNRWLKHVSCKIIQYDKIELVKPQCEKELMDDLRERTGLDIIKVEVGGMDFLRDTAVVKVYYEPASDEINIIDSLMKTSKEE